MVVWAVAGLSAAVAFGRETVDLAGEWECADGSRTITKADGGAGAKVSVVQSELPPPTNAVWKKVTLPGPQPWVPEKIVRHYRRSFALPQFGSDQVVKLVFDKPFYRIRVRVNGTEVGDGEPWGLAWECDATKAAKPGTNELEVLISNELDVNGPWKSMVRAGWSVANYFGLRRGVRAEIRPKLHVTDVRAVTKVFPKPKLTAVVSFSDGTSKTYEKECPDAKPWTPDTPNLYTFSLKDLGCDFPDDYAIRVGFRELDWSGKRFKMNGHPFIHRRQTTGPDEKNDDPEAVRRHIRLLKSRGVVGSRVFLPADVELFARIADEEGFLVATCAPVGSCAEHKTDDFWERVFPDYMREQIRQQGNHPSIICWGLGNEFGAPYAGKDATCPKQAAFGAKVQQMDPTRPWCYYGEIEKGNPVRGPGPQPIRSIHYPWGPTGHLMPECSQWAVNGASWHGRWGKDKPMVISEDLYHGMNDQFVGMAKWGGDSIYTARGCFRACMTAYHWFALGYYRAGVSGWEPWATFAASDVNPIYDTFGQPMPDFLFAPKSWHRNFFSGERKTVDFDLFNQTFTPFDGKLVLTTFVDGREVRSRKVPVSIPQGEGRTVSLSLEAPRTDTPVAWTLVADIPGKLHETVEFFVFPRVRLADLGPNVMTNALSRQEGLALAKEVAAGRRVLLLDVPQGGWAPFEIARKGPGTVNFLFKRDLRHLARIPEGALACWRPVGTNRACVATSSYVKPSWTDAEVWLDSGTGNGLCRANVMRLPAGKGFWLLCQLPLLERLETEPAAGWLLKELLSELEAGKADFPKKTVSGDAELLKVFNIPTAPEGEVLYANAVTPKLLSAVKTGGRTLWLSEPTAAFPSDWPIEFIAQTNKEWICRYTNRLPGPDAPFVSLSRRIPGLSSEDLFWWKPDSMWPYWQRTEVGGVSMWIREFALTGAIRVKNGATGVKSFTEPTDAMVAFQYGKGLVFVSTLNLSANVLTQAPKVERTVRRIFNFLGVRTDDAELVLPRTWRPDDLSDCNAILYHEKEPDPAKVWFGSGDDMRYFPVNQCGWSVAANNKCPVDPWPRGTIPIQGVPFKFRNPGDKKPSPNVCRIAPGDRVGFWGSFHGHEACPRRVWFLGACEKPPTRGCLEVEVPYVTGPNRIDRKTKTTFEHGRHFGAYASVEKLSEGRVAWRGATKTLCDAALYLWHLDTPPEHAQHRLDAMPIRNTMDVPMVILGITEEY